MRCTEKSSNNQNRLILSMTDPEDDYKITVAQTCDLFYQLSPAGQ